MRKYSKYKDSGIELIGIIPEHWDVILFKRIIHQIKDGTHGSFQRVSEGYPFLSAKNVHNDGLRISENESLISKVDYREVIKNGFPSKNDLLITCVGTIGRTFVYNLGVSHAFQRSVTFIRFNENINSQFYKYYAESSFFQNLLVSLAKTSAQSGVYMGDLMNTNSLKLPFSEQNAIANYLDRKTSEIDTLIENKEKLIELLKEERTAIINHAVTKGINLKVKLKPSGVEWIGEIPEHWEVKRVDWVSNIVRGNSAFKKDELLDTGEYVALQYGKTYKVDIVDEDFKFFVNSEFYKESQVVSKGDTILVSTSETIEDLGHSCYYDNENIGLIGGEQILLKPNREVLNEKYLYYYTRKLGSLLRKYAKGLKVYRYNTNDLKQIFFAIPPKKEQEIIANYLDQKSIEIDNLVSKTEKEIGLLNEYKTALISEVVTGKIDVREEVLV